MKHMKATMRARSLLVVPAICAAVAVCSSVVGASGQILERCGAVDGYVIGAHVRNYLSRITTSPQFDSSGPYVTTVDRVRLGLDPGTGEIREITLASPGAFTQRYIVIGEATLRDVLERYGPPISSRPVGGDIVVFYPDEGVAFTFADIGTFLPTKTDARVSAVTIYARNYDMGAQAGRRRTECSGRGPGDAPKVK
jgi:hypothetical protein